eukprot:GHVU01209727.1.p1 GENE.GHVU01209727.1~~GHVU01209727.1.p1  ORF type:complete len:235 (+),score=29.95 GHVU01209727.1:852-1556(+)
MTPYYYDDGIRKSATAVWCSSEQQQHQQGYPMRYLADPVPAGNISSRGVGEAQGSHLDALFDTNSRQQQRGGDGGPGGAGSAERCASAQHMESGDTNGPADREKKVVALFSKTRMCPWHLKGQCSHGERCSFAHSEAELRPKPMLRKTLMCSRVRLTGSCSLGDKCDFAHNVTELTERSAYKTKLCKHMARGYCAAGALCRYAHSDRELVLCTTEIAKKPQPSQQQQQQHVCTA